MSCGCALRPADLPSTTLRQVLNLELLHLAIVTTTTSPIVIIIISCRQGPGGSRNCFGRGTLDLSRRRRRSETRKALRGEVWEGFTSSPADYGFGERRKLLQWSLGAPAAQPLMVFGHYIRNFVRFNACFSSFWNLTGKVNKTDLIRPLLPTTGLEGARAPCAPPPSGSAHGCRNRTNSV